MSEIKRSLAKCREFDFAIEDHGCPILYGTFEYEDGGIQSLGYQVDIAFLMRFMCALGVDQLSKVNGKSCFVTHTFNNIMKIEPLHKKEGTPFDIQEWIEWKKTREWPSAYEMRTGKK